MKHFVRLLAVPALALALLNGCTRPDPTPALPTTTSSSADATAVAETFETGTKTSYTVGPVILASGSWTFDDALLGNSTSDAKTGTQAARLRNSGKLTMGFDLSGGAGTVTLDHARYGTDAASTWELWASANSGSTYTKVGSTVSTSGTTLQTASFAVNLPAPVRLEIRKTDGTTARLNLDNLNVQPYGGTTPPPATGGKKFLFDGSHAETAGNADWVPDEDAGRAARYPTPAQSGITASTSEGYWTGGLSAWGVALAKLGNTVETLPSGVAISYGNTTNAQDLANYSVFVVDEPNTRFSDAEKTAILRFVQNGGGLFMISDHNISDRNNDGWDSPAIWNDLMTTNSVQANPFGLRVELTNISETTANVKAGANPILNGSQGAVTQLKFSNGATIATTTATPLIWRGSVTQGSTAAMCASSTFGTGRVVLITDSSPADDGTGSTGHTLYPGWTEIASHSRLHLNASLWLAQQQ